jgi:hypothetical protein
MKWLDKFPYPLLIILALTLGLAPFTPLPHLAEKMTLLFAKLGRRLVSRR